MTSRDSESIATTFRFRFGPHLDVGQPQVESETWEDVKSRFKNQTRLPFFGAHLAGHSRTADIPRFAPAARTRQTKLESRNTSSSSKPGRNVKRETNGKPNANRTLGQQRQRDERPHTYSTRRSRAGSRKNVIVTSRLWALAVTRATNAQVIQDPIGHGPSHMRGSHAHKTRMSCRKRSPRTRETRRHPDPPHGHVTHPTPGTNERNYSTSASSSVQADMATPGDTHRAAWGRWMLDKRFTQRS